jgi:asparagine synthase (glutamine-hydrolysing)
VAFDARHGWRTTKTPHGTLHANGDPVSERALLALVAGGKLPSAGALAAAVRPARGFWALIFEGSAGVVAAVDHVRSLPLFYANGSSGPVVGDDARAVAAAADLRAIDPIGAEDLALAAYATGAHTLIAGLSQLVAGEVAVWPSGGPPACARHHDYRPPETSDVPPIPVYDLGAALDATIDRLVAKAAGRPIGVPLSGGLDSRLVLAKLVERAYLPLFSFSYGPQGNSDAAVARMVAERLGADWRFVSTRGRQIRAFFDSPERRDYWRFADGLSALPSMQDVLPLKALRHALPRDAMIVNGNSGDFISGAHIPSRLSNTKSVAPVALLDAIVDKHFSLWRPLLTPERRRAVQTRIADAIALNILGPALSADAAASAYERYEYAERHCKFVVNGQRSYEWHGLAWHLPLWDRELVELFARAPLADRAGQSLYRRYLQDWDYRGVFSGVTQTVTAWPRLTSAALAPLAVGLRLVAGRARRDRMFRYLNYFDRFGDHYKAFGFREFARHAQETRNPASLYVRTWLGENGVKLEELAGV